MKLMHLSDLHLGKRVNEFSMMEDQKYILDEIIKIADTEKPDSVLICGDVYDKSVPSAEAVELLDDFLCRLAERNLKVLMISGNHDSAERVAFGGRLMEGSGVHISPVYDGTVDCVTMSDQWGEVRIYLLPFLKPAHVRRFYPDEETESYTEALRTALTHANIDREARNVLLTHQFVTGATRCDSEELSVGGTDNVDASIFDDFDYVALGHIHGPQHVGRETIRYSGSPLKYSFSEAKHQKSVTIVEMRKKGNIGIRAVPLIPMHDMREIRGTYMELTARSFYGRMVTDDYLHITLTDENDIPNAFGKLNVIYPNLMKLSYDNARTRGSYTAKMTTEGETLSPPEVFAKFFERQNRRSMTDEQKEYILRLTERIWEDEA